MSLNLDDWLKPPEEPNVPPNPEIDDEDPITNSLAAADLQLPDLGLPDIKWWVDLEFLDLASGPPANINSGQDRNKNKHNPTLGNYFPDIFFDTTGQGTSSLFGGSNDDTHRSLINDQAFESFEKGLLADLFPSTSTGNEDKLLDEFATAADSEPSKPEELKEASEPEAKPVEDEDEEAYSVPMEVLHSISKNFEKLHADFEKSSEDVDDNNRVIRIKSIRSVPPDVNIEEVLERPEGTVATIAIQTNKAENTTTFTILPRIGQSSKQSFLVRTNNLSQATKMIKPLHLDRLPVFKKLFHNIRVEPPYGSSSKLKNQDKEDKPKPTKKVIKDPGTLETDLLKELADYDVHYDKIEISKIGNKFEWTCPEPTCERLFDKRSQLVLHIWSHHNIKPFKCNHEGCKWSFATEVKLKRHLITHEDLPKPFKCNLPGCIDRSFSTVYNLNAHIKTHSVEDTFSCAICVGGFRNQRTLDLHMKSDHGSPNYTCPQCNNSYYTKTDLDKHILGHQKEAKTDLICHDCNKPFPTKFKLQAHQRVHTGERPFACQYLGCTWTFRTSSKLRRHERSHTNDRRYACQACDKTYLRPEHLKDHVAVVHKNQRLACPFDQCQARFTHRVPLIVHVKKHQEEKPQSDQKFRCVMEKCGKKFQSRRNLSQHVNKFHRPEMDSYGESQVDNADQSELDLIAILSSVNEEDIKKAPPSTELTTVDASAITPVKSEPNIISKGRKRKSQIVKHSKKSKDNNVIDEASTINMQDLA